jgi:hypothetical protein
MCESDGRATGGIRILSWLDRERWEGLEWESSSTWCERLDEFCSERVDLLVNVSMWFKLNLHYREEMN